MSQTNPSGNTTDLDILNLNSDVVKELTGRQDEPYSLNMHQEHYDEVDEPGFPREFMEIAAEPLFQDFSTGRPNYTTETDPEVLATDFNILRNFHDYVESNTDSITHPADIDVKMQFLSDYIGGKKQERAARYVMETARRLEGDDYQTLEGMQMTTPYDFRDVMEVLEEHGHHELPEAEESDVRVVYGPDVMTFDDFETAYSVRGDLKERYQQREYLNKGEPPVMEILSED